MFPAFSWDFCHGLGYDIKNTKSKTGAFSNIALKRVDFKRTKHPIYSFAVYGKYQNELIKMENRSSFGKDSPFGFMHSHGAKMIIVNLELNNSFTFVHYVEQFVNINYRFHKDFKGFYINEFNEKEERVYSMFVRKNGIITELKSLEKLFIKQNVMKVKHVLGNEIKIIDLNLAYNVIINDIKFNEAKNLYHSENI